MSLLRRTLFLCLLSFSAGASPISYPVHHQIGNVRLDGYLVSDGTLGVWSTGQPILDFSLIITVIEGGTSRSQTYGWLQRGQDLFVAQDLFASPTRLLLGPTGSVSASGIYQGWGLRMEGTGVVRETVSYASFLFPFGYQVGGASSIFTIREPYVIASIPEPATGLLLALGLLGLGRRRRG